MKRMVLFVSLIVLSLCVTAVWAQVCAPGPMGPPMPLMPPPGPGNGIPNMGPAPQPLFPGPCMMPICKPPLSLSTSVVMGWQVNNDPVVAKFSTRGVDLFNATGIYQKFNLDGFWLGGSARLSSPDGWGLRVEVRNLFPSKDKVTTVVPMAVGLPGSRAFNGNSAWRILDGTGSLQLAPNVSILGGVRYDFFDVTMTGAPDIVGFSTTADRGDFTQQTVIPYVGFEGSWTGCTSGFMVRAIGSPVLVNWTKFGMTFGDPQRLPPIRDYYNDGASKYGTFFEGSINYGHRFGQSFTIGAFASLQAQASHTERTMHAVRLEPDFLALSQTFDLDVSKRSAVIGGSVTMALSLPGM